LRARDLQEDQKYRRIEKSGFRAAASEAGAALRAEWRSDHQPLLTF